jgi:hypothetical protein
VDLTEYSPRRVVEALGEEWEPLPSDDWLQIAYRPSFDAELVATAWRIGEATRLRARTAQCSLWTIHLHEHHPMSISPTEPVPEARPATLERAVEEHDAESLWRAVSAVRAADAPEARLGLDGMPVTVRCRVADSHVERELWSVRRDDVDRPVVEHVLALIRASGDDRLTLVADRAANYLS